MRTQFGMGGSSEGKSKSKTGVAAQTATMTARTETRSVRSQRRCCDGSGVELGEVVDGGGAGASNCNEIEEEVADNFGGAGRRKDDVGLIHRSSSSVNEEAGEMVRLVRKGELSEGLEDDEVNDAHDG